MLISVLSANRCQNISQFGRGLVSDQNGNLVDLDLSGLNLIGTIYLRALSQTVRSLDLRFNDLDNLNLSGLRDKSLKKLNVEHNRRCHVNTESFNLELGHTLPIWE